MIPGAGRARGMALLAGLVLMVAVSLLAVTAAGGMALQQHQAANFSARQQAFAHADLARSWGLAWLYSRPSEEREAACETDCFLPMAIHAPAQLPVQAEFMQLAWWQANGVVAGADPAAAADERGYVTHGECALWLIEEIHYAPRPDTAPGVEGIGYYRILARGAANGSVVVSESIVARPWGEAVRALPYPPTGALSGFCPSIGLAVPCGQAAWRLRR